MAESNKTIRFASINIQGDKNLEEVVSFLKNFKPDVVCFQELIESRKEFFEKILGMKGYFLPMSRDNRLNLDVFFGIGLYSNFPMNNIHSEYYYGGSGNVPVFILGDEKSVWRGFIRATVLKDGKSFTVATTHFTRTPDGSTSEKQREDLKKLFELFESVPELILCGDFNAPRGGEIFTALAEKYKDNIPPQYLSSLDSNLHKLKNSKLLMVDGLFTTPDYIVTEVKLSEGVSDHMAVTALISKD